MSLRSLPSMRLIHQMSWPGWWLASLLILASLSSSALGVAWFLFAFAGLWQLLPSITPNKSPPYPSSLGIWVLAAVTGFSAKALLTVYWHDPWAERHGEIRILLGAIAAYGAHGYWRDKPIQRQTLLTWVSHALSLTSLLGLLWVAWQGRGHVASHPIPWAGVMALFSCWLLAVGLDKGFSWSQRRWWLAGSGSAVLAVLASQSRGFFVVALWWLGIMAVQGWNTFKKSPQPWLKPSHTSITIGSMALLVLTLSYTPLFERPLMSLRAAVSEVRISLGDPTEGSNSSVGARLYMWRRSAQAIAQSPWLGYGHDGRKQLLNTWAEEAGSDEIHRLGHVHNEYLHQLIDHGLPGLISQLAFLLGLLCTTLQLRRNGSSSAAMALGGMLLVYAVGNLSNVNFAHNYFTAGLSLMTGLSIGVLGLSQTLTTKQAPPPARSSQLTRQP